MVKDEAMTVVRSARAVKLMGEVSSPEQVKNVSEVEAALTKWISRCWRANSARRLAIR